MGLQSRTAGHDLDVRLPVPGSVKTYRRDIDGLRAIAVLPVVFEHAGIPGFPGGFIGVDIFFVISGFLITGILTQELQQGRFSILRFYERRARRILPALFALLAVCTVAGFFWFPPWQYDALARSAIATTLFVSNFWFMRTTGGYFGDDANYEPLLHTWSLAVEEQFYIVFPIVLWLLFRVNKRWIKPALIATCILSFMVSVWAAEYRPVANFFMAPTRAWELGLGALLAMGLVPQCHRQGIVQSVGLAGLAAIIVAIAVYDDATPFPGLTAALPCLGAAALLWAGGHDRATLVSRLLQARLLVGVGLISYSLYLWHWPPLVLARGFSGSLNPGWDWKVGTLLFACAMAWASWRYVERPFRRSAQSGGMSQKVVFSSTAAGGLALLAIFGMIAATDGMRFRANPADMMTYEQAVPPEKATLAIGRRCLSTSQIGKCLLGKPLGPADTPTLMIWGDSHAAALLPGFDIWAKAQGISAVAATRPGCPPLVGVDRADFEPRKRCLEFNLAAMRYIMEHPEIRHVILTGRWATVSQGTRFSGEAGKPVVLMTSDGDTPGNDVLFESGLSGTIQKLRKSGREVTIIEDVPEVGFNVPKAFIGQQFYGTTMPRGQTAQELARRSGNADAVIERLARSYSARVIKSAPYICTPDCAVMLDGHLLYSDDDHLSQYAAKWLVPLAIAGLEKPR